MLCRSRTRHIPKMKHPLKLAIIGCGSRGRTYASIAASMPARMQLIAAADPNPRALDTVEDSAKGPIQRFQNASELIAARPEVDLAVIATQDGQHFNSAIGSLQNGWHLLLEKPAATSLPDCQLILKAAREARRHVLLCYVLRYTPFYRAVKGVLDSGRLGRIISIAASEGVEPWHQVHSFVRGHWSRTADSSPMILAKSSHDADLLAWLTGQPCRRVSSYGSLTYFKPEYAPIGATARCTGDCPHAGSCQFDAHRYATDKRRWLAMLRPDAEELSEEAIYKWLETSPWGRCAWHCDNDVVDNQVVSMEFEQEITATFTMSAFDSGRRLTICGSEGTLRGGSGLKEGPGGAEIWIRNHSTEQDEAVVIDQADYSGYEGHGGGDFGLIDSIEAELAKPFSEDWIQSHLICFAAEQSRLARGAKVELQYLEC